MTGGLQFPVLRPRRPASFGLAALFVCRWQHDTSGKKHDRTDRTFRSGVYAFLFIGLQRHQEQMKAGIPPNKPIVINQPGRSGSANISRRTITARIHPTIAAPIGRYETSMIAAIQAMERTAALPVTSPRSGGMQTHARPAFLCCLTGRTSHAIQAGTCTC
ncbi:MAG: hypothetical protein QOE39_1751 [Bradyrhizobium sp.]|nr:hypothetical protein [Bradyrhizobium sp.]